MLFFFVSFLSFLLFTKPLLLKLLPSWVSEMRLLLVLLFQESLYYSLQWLNSYRCITTQILKYPYTMFSNKKCASRLINNVEEEKVSASASASASASESAEAEAEAEAEADTEMIVLDLPELALECILGKLSPSGLCSMASVCTSLKDRCRSDHLWEKHMKEKWGRVIGKAAQKEWELCIGSRKESRSGNGLLSTSGRPNWWIESLSCLWPRSWLMSKQANGSVDAPKSHLPVDSVMVWYLALESGRFRFPAQVYNRENGHVGFMLSCYDAELSYDSLTDTFHARYHPHGQRLANVEEGVKWERIRAPPVATLAHDLHVSDCLNDLHPGDHIEIQWRRNKEFPYGWWYGIVGHLESCGGNDHRCHCFSSDTVILEFNHYTPDSRWRRTTVNRKDHREEGNETDGFYGGIRKLYNKDEISMWRKLWPTEILE